MFEKILNLQLQLLILMLLGIVVKRKKIINDSQQKGLSELLLNVLLPATIIKSFIANESISNELIKNSIVMITICLIIQIVLIIILPKVLKSFGSEKARIMEYGLLVSNSSFIGIPIIEYLYDSQAVMYASIYLIPLRFTMWTIGLALFDKNINLKKGIGKTLSHPCIVAVMLGFILLLTNIKLPTAITGSIEMVAKSTNCISMITVGCALADIDYKNLFDFPTAIYTFLRLIILPLSVYFILSALGIDKLLISISVLLTAMPCASSCPVLAQKYDCDYKFAAKLVLITTILSVITIPCICLLL